MSEENKDDDILFIWNAIKDIFKAKFQDIITSDILSMFEAKKTVEKQENRCKASEFRDIYNKLSEDAQNAIQDVKGPLKGENFLKLLLDDILDKPCKKILPIIRRYSDDVDGVNDQMSEVIQIVEKRMEYRKKQEKMDIKLIKKCKEVKEAIEKEKKSSKTQRSMDEFLTPKITKINKVGNAGSKKAPYLKKQLPAVSDKLAKRRDKKRKSGISENGVADIASEINKRLRITSPENSIESMSLGEPEELNDENTDPMSLVDSEESCSQHNEPMSICSSEGSLSDAMSVDEPTKIIKDKKLLEMSKTSSKKVGTELENDTSGSRKNEKTVSEIGFYLRSGRLR